MECIIVDSCILTITDTKEYAEYHFMCTVIVRLLMIILIKDCLKI